MRIGAHHNSRRGHSLRYSAYLNNLFLQGQDIVKYECRNGLGSSLQRLNTTRVGGAVPKVIGSNSGDAIWINLDLKMR
jgi:hypothetical protein